MTTANDIFFLLFFVFIIWLVIEIKREAKDLNTFKLVAVMLFIFIFSLSLVVCYFTELENGKVYEVLSVADYRTDSYCIVSKSGETIKWTEIKKEKAQNITAGEKITVAENGDFLRIK